MDQERTPKPDERHIRSAAPDGEENIEHERPAGIPPADNDDLGGHDSAVADSFPASDPPANY
jgi:hypothetical protein